MKYTTLHIALPENWHEVPDMQPRLFRSQSEDSGCLQLSLLPVLETPEDLVGQLRSHLANAPDLGEELSATEEEAPLGPMASILYRNAATGALFRAWMIAGPATVFGTYTMGALGRADYEMKECATILRGLRFVSTLETFDVYSPAAEETEKPWWRVW